TIVRGQLGEHVVTRILTPGVGQFTEIAAQLGRCLGAAAFAGAEVAGGGVDGFDDGVCPNAEAWFVLAGYAEQPGDHRDWEGIGEVVEEVDLVATSEVVDQTADDFRQVGVHPNDAVGIVWWPEVPVQESPYPIVLGRVEGDEVGRQPRHALAVASPVV